MSVEWQTTSPGPSRHPVYPQCECAKRKVRNLSSTDILRRSLGTEVSELLSTSTKYALLGDQSMRLRRKASVEWTVHSNV